jgi:hypothetical protein
MIGFSDCNFNNDTETGNNITPKKRPGMLIPGHYIRYRKTGSSGEAPVTSNEMNLLGLQLFGKTRLGSGGFILMNNALAGSSIEDAGKTFELRGFFIAALLGSKILYRATQCRFDLAVFLPISFRGLHSLGRRFVCRQSILLCSKFKKTNITGS